MVKKLIRLSAAHVLSVSGVLGRIERKHSNCLTILCYHRVLPKKLKEKTSLPDLAVTPESFDEQCMILSECYTVLPLHEAIQAINNSDQTHSKPIAVITFDDGYADNYEYALPILEKYRLRATFFIIAGLIGTRDVSWYDKIGRGISFIKKNGQIDLFFDQCSLYEHFQGSDQITPWNLIQYAKKLTPDSRKKILHCIDRLVEDSSIYSRDRIVNSDEIRSIHEQNHEIGSHTLSHELLSNFEEPSVILEQLSDSKKKLEAVINAPVYSFCYPNGSYNEATIDFVKRADYRYACTTKSGINMNLNTPFELKRIYISEERLFTLSGRTSRDLFRLEISGMARKLFLRRS